MPSNFSIARALGLIGSILIVVVSALLLFVFLSLTSEILRENREEGLQALSSIFMIEIFISQRPPFLMGWLLLIASLYFFSRIYNEGRIFRYAIYSLVASIVGGGVLAALLITIGASPFVAMSAAFIGSAILMSYFMYRSFSLLAEKSGVHLFKVGGILMLAAAITLIIFVGLFLRLAGAIALAVAFYSIKPPVEGATQPSQRP